MDTEVVKFLYNSNLKYFYNNEFEKNVVIRHKLVEFYEKFKIK